jgi:beta-N-acetylhexosaminidase
MAVVLAACSAGADDTINLGAAGSTSSGPAPSAPPASADTTLASTVTGSGTGGPAGSADISTTVRSAGGDRLEPSSSEPAVGEATSPRTRAELDCIASWPIEMRVAQLVMPAVRGEDLDEVGGVLGPLEVGGIIVMTWPDRQPNDVTSEQLLDLKTTTKIPMLAAVDEEGGSVQRLRSTGRLPAAAEMAATRTPVEATQAIADHAGVVANLGFDVVFAPVVDVAPDDGGGPIGNRSFGSDPALVTEYASAYIRGWQSAGVLPVLKHFPGHGRATADSHDGAAMTPPLAELRTRDLLPYQLLATSGAGVMVGHLDVPDLTEEGRPASVSAAAITDLLRGELGYADAIVFTDSLSMGAIAERFTVPDAAVAAVAAGADVALLASVDDAAPVIDAMEAAIGAGTLTEPRVNDAVRHVLAAKHVDPCSLESG